jgi:hypothetical protein
MNASPAQVHLVAMGVHIAWLVLSVLLFRASARGMLIEGDGSPAQSVFVIGALNLGGSRVRLLPARRHESRRAARHARGALGARPLDGAARYHLPGRNLGLR